jgi:hypothetical protein
MEEQSSDCVSDVLVKSIFVSWSFGFFYCLIFGYSLDYLTQVDHSVHHSGTRNSPLSSRPLLPLCISVFHVSSVMIS